MALAATTTKDPADQETTNQHGDKYNDWHNKASQQREALFFKAILHNTHCSPSNRNPQQLSESKLKAQKQSLIAKKLQSKPFFVFKLLRRHQRYKRDGRAAR